MNNQDHWDTKTLNDMWNHLQMCAEIVQWSNNAQDLEQLIDVVFFYIAQMNKLRESYLETVPLWHRTKDESIFFHNLNNILLSLQGHAQIARLTSEPEDMDRLIEVVLISVNKFYTLREMIEA